MATQRSAPLAAPRQNGADKQKWRGYTPPAAGPRTHCSEPPALGASGVDDHAGGRASATHANIRSVSIKGRPYTWFKAALARGDLAGVRAAAAELPHVDLTDALAVCLLMSRRDDPSYERAA